MKKNKSKTNKNGKRCKTNNKRVESVKKVSKSKKNKKTTKKEMLPTIKDLEINKEEQKSAIVEFLKNNKKLKEELIESVEKEDVYENETLNDKKIDDKAIKNKKVNDKEKIDNINNNNKKENVNKEKRNKTEKIRNAKIKKYLLDIAFIVFIIIIGISIYNIVKWFNSSKKTNKMIQEISQYVKVIDDENNETEQAENNNPKYQVDFKSLKKINPDVVAWVKVNGTTIETPIVKTTNNDFYLAHSLDKSYNLAGWIFADYRNVFDGNDKNIIIYGHNMRDGTMFNTLKKVINPEWYENLENHKIIFVTEEGEFEYQVFSTYQIEEENYDTTINFSSINMFEKYIENAKNRSVYNYGVEVTKDDQILTLSTCANNNKYRVILHAKKLVENNTTDNEVESN